MADAAQPPLDAPAPDVIRDAACVVLVDTRSGQPKLLLGRRHADQIFLPDKWVFPGGRLDAEDRRLAATAALAYVPDDLAPALRPFALAAIRELHEETGYLLGRMAETDGSSQQAFASGHVPEPLHIQPLARAITPPGRIRRYDTWFFIAKREAISLEPGAGDGELLDLDWFTIEDASKLDLPNITRLVLQDVVCKLDGATTCEAGHVPFYRQELNGFARTLISCRAAPGTA